jgi:hypothetical protein
VEVEGCADKPGDAGSQKKARKASPKPIKVELKLTNK